MLLFSRKSRDGGLGKKPSSELPKPDPSPVEAKDPTPPSRTWLSTLRKRTMSVDSFSNIFSPSSATQGTRKYSANSNGGASITSMGGTTKLMKSHRMQTKNGDAVELYFGYDALSMNGRSIAYGEIVFWSHSASHFTMTFLLKNTAAKRKDVVLYPTTHGPKPSEITEMISMRIARLLADQTGCSEEKAIRMATQRANEHDLKQASEQLDRQSLEDHLNGGGSRPGSRSRLGRTGSNFGGSGIIELSTIKTTKAISIDEEEEGEAA
ncbi:hypothetical protein BASA81_000780 [Batrachochytrium salamandrivorans]|nr:hypothetical protein BASA81_000780 [Batrachochytrium salamandrivorans]